MSRLNLSTQENYQRSKTDIGSVLLHPPPPVPNKQWLGGSQSIEPSKDIASIITATTVPRTGSFVAELSQRLEQAERMEEPVHSIKPTPPPTRSHHSSTRHSNHHLLVPFSPSAYVCASASACTCAYAYAYTYACTCASASTSASASTTSFYDYSSSSGSSNHLPTPIGLKKSVSSPKHRSASFSTLRFPLPRSTTGTNVNSMNSTCSTSSLATITSRKGWSYGPNISSWLSGSTSDDLESFNFPTKQRLLFPHLSLNACPTVLVSKASELSPPTTTTLQPSTEEKDTLLPSKEKIIKRRHVVHELIETENSYYNDMQLVKEVFYDKACASHSPLSAMDVKQLFSNLLAILAFESKFVPLLYEAYKQEKNEEERIGMGYSVPDTTSLGMHQKKFSFGSVFRLFMLQLVQVYGEYCKRHEDALHLLQELESKPAVSMFLNGCREDLKGRTMCWDLPSLLIKPVQRVLKYPLLLKELYSLTPPSHPDHEDLREANKGIQQVADTINELKRRKDIVEKIVREKKRTDMNRFRYTTGLSAEPTQDAVFDVLHWQFEAQQENARQWMQAIQEGGQQMKKTVEDLYTFLGHLETFYSTWESVRDKSVERVQSIHQATQTLSYTISHQVDTLIQDYMCHRVEAFLKLFETPSQVIRKRSKKLLDHDWVRDMKAKGDVPDKATQASADTYQSINAQLIDELPKFLALTRRYFVIIEEDHQKVQKTLTEHITREWRKCIEKYIQLDSTKNTRSYCTIISTYQRQMRNVQPCIDSLLSLRLDLLDRSSCSSSFLSSRESSESLMGMVNRSYYKRQWPGLSTTRETSSVYSSSLACIELETDKRNVGYQQSNGTPVEKMVYSKNSYESLISKQMSMNVYRAPVSFLVEGSDPVFECVILSNLKSQEPETLSVQKGDIVQIWLPKTHQDDTQWWYGSLKMQSTLSEPVFGWIPSWYCQRI
ncbi:hypothetical protein BDF14DRAFT_1994343 [Spinellus fusiger]|nr:hypothetical protein BDF14DRAFT_1994343 [Spinellus fusiger]